MPGSAKHPTRRTLLLAGLALPLAGCGIRLERDAPEIPGIPTQAPPADTAVVQATITRLRAVAAALRDQEPATWTAPLQRLHTDQADALERIAASAGITITAAASSTGSTPTSTGTATSTSAGKSTASTSGTTAKASKATATTSDSGVATSSTATAYPGATTEADAITTAEVTAAAAATSANRPALLATLAGHRAGARLLGGPAQPTPTGLSPAAAAAVLEPVRVAVYVAELLIARTAAKDRGELDTLLTLLYAERMRLGSEAGKSAKPEQLSYALPAASHDPVNARSTMAGLLHDCVIAAAGQAGTANSGSGAAREVQLWGDLVAATWHWGQTPQTFLGLR